MEPERQNEREDVKDRSRIEIRKATNKTILLTLIPLVPSPLCPHQQVKCLHATVIRTLVVEQNATQQVGGDILGGIVTRLQQVR